MRKILFVMLASLLVLGLGCTARTKTPAVKAGGANITRNPSSYSDPDPTPDPDEGDKGGSEKGSGSEGDRGSGSEGDRGSGSEGDRGSGSEGGSRGGGSPSNTSPIKISTSIEQTIEEWDGTKDYVPSGHSMKELGN